MIPVLKKHSLFLFVLFAATGLSAQDYDIRCLDMRSGLSNNHVVSAAQDKRGYLWFATEEGLNFFDGLSFIPFYKSASGSGLAGNELNCVLDDPVDSVLWIGTQRAGLNAYDYSTRSVRLYRHDKDNPSSLITDDITDISPARDGNLWIATYWEGVDYLDKDTGNFTHVNMGTVDGLVSNQAWCVLEPEDGLLYIGHVRHGLSVVNLRTRRAVNFVHYPENPESLPGNDVSCLYADRYGHIWVGTDKGLALFDSENGRFIRVSDSPESQGYRVFDIRQVDDRHLWVAMEFGGIAILDISQSLYNNGKRLDFSYIRERHDRQGLSNGSVRCLLQDSFGNIWAGTWGGGINLILQEEPLFSSYTYSPYNSFEPHALTDKSVSTVCFDTAGNMWVGTNSGDIDLFSKDVRKAVYPVGSGQGRSHSVQASLCDSRGRLWFGFFNGGVLLCDPSTRRFTPVLPRHLGGLDVRCFFEDDKGNILVGCSGGVYVLDGEDCTLKLHFGTDNSLVRCLAQDASGRYLVGYYGSGIGLHDRSFNELKVFNVDDGLPSNTINDLLLDGHKRLWVATGDGLVCFPEAVDGSFRVIGRAEGLPNANIQALQEDLQGNIWLSTNRGINCLPLDSDTIYSYVQQDMMPAGSFFASSAARDAEGRMYFGALDGLCHFRPEEVLRQRSSPPALINSLVVYGPSEGGMGQVEQMPMYGRGSVRLRPDQNSFSVSFNVLDYALYGRVEYSYRMRGLDDNWYPVSGNNVTFRNLSHGNYRFMVRTRMPNQQWSAQESGLDITVLPRPWQTWWAKLVYVLAVALAVGLLFQTYKRRLRAETGYRMERQSREREQELNNERLRFYTNITHELRTPLTLIVGPLDDLRKSPTLSPRDARKIGVIHQSAMRLLALINQILDFRKTETRNKKLSVMRANILSTVREVSMKYKELNRNPNVDIRVQLPAGQIQLYFDAEVIGTILDNLISNAMKYTERGTIEIGVRQQEREGVGYTDIYVSDTGHGISAYALPHIFESYYQEGGSHQASGTGIGLALVKNLVELHEGFISVESEPDKGSTFCVSLITDNYYPDSHHAGVLPAAPPAADAPEGEAPGERPIALVVEDNEDICTYIADALSDSFDVRVASDGKAGQEMALSLIPDIVVSDIMMPVMDGETMCRLLKNDIRTSHIPIILLTAKDTIKDKEEGYAAGADSYLTKPFSASLLLSRINNLLDSRRKLAERFASAGNTSVKSEKAAMMLESLGKIDSEFLSKIDSFIEQRLSSDKVDIGYLSDKMCMSSSTLYRKIKALTGLSTNEYVRKLRMKRAEALLLEGKWNISEIAFKTGFSNLFYFRQCFREEFGCNPSEYIKRLKSPSA